jgi:hypothetical protein
METPFLPLTLSLVPHPPNKTEDWSDLRSIFSALSLGPPICGVIEHITDCMQARGRLVPPRLGDRSLAEYADDWLGEVAQASAAHRARPRRTEEGRASQAPRLLQLQGPVVSSPVLFVLSFDLRAQLEELSTKAERVAARSHAPRHRVHRSLALRCTRQWRKAWRRSWTRKSTAT